MKTLIVYIKVKSDQAEAFVAATLENMAQSRREPGISRFELLRDEADPCRFLLLETYAGPEAQASHKETAHYSKWKDLVEPMMAEPRTRASYAEIEP